MSLFLPHTFHPNHLTHSSSPFHVKCSFKFRTKAPTITNATIPARDRVIDLGKHKGKMLGALPSSYLKWVSKNLRARDFEEWAKLADQVLQDPIYNDRIEWEFAEKLLNGNNFNVSLLRNYESSVSELLEISERFGWDNKDKLGWSKVSFELLGTSKGGRIPRVSKNSGKERGLDVEKNVEVLSKGKEKMKERRVRLRMKKREAGIKEESKDGFGNKVYGNAGCRDDVIRFQRDTKNGQEQKMEFYNPFPGREALLKARCTTRKEPRDVFHWLAQNSSHKLDIIALYWQLNAQPEDPRSGDHGYSKADISRFSAAQGSQVYKAIDFRGRRLTTSFLLNVLFFILFFFYRFFF